MTNNDIRLFMEVTKRQAEEAFRRQLDESNRRIEMHRAASRILCGDRVGHFGTSGTAHSQLRKGFRE